MATLKDVAKETGLTVTTVSHVLNNRGYISEETRKKVYDAMKKLNYHPNEVARSLSKQSTNTIGVIVPHIRHPYFAELISNLESQAYRHQHKILLFNSQEKNEGVRVSGNVFQQPGGGDYSLQRYGRGERISGTQCTVNYDRVISGERNGGSGVRQHPGRTSGGDRGGTACARRGGTGGPEPHHAPGVSGSQRNDRKEDGGGR